MTITNPGMNAPQKASDMAKSMALSYRDIRKWMAIIAMNPRTQIHRIVQTHDGIASPEFLMTTTTMAAMQIKMMMATARLPKLHPDQNCPCWPNKNMKSPLSPSTVNHLTVERILP